MANQSVRLKEEQLRREEEKLREVEFQVSREIQVKRQELLAKEDSLRVLEARLSASPPPPLISPRACFYADLNLAAQNTGNL
jgi:cell division control protein 11